MSIRSSELTSQFRMKTYTGFPMSQEESEDFSMRQLGRLMESDFQRHGDRSHGRQFELQPRPTVGCLLHHRRYHETS